MEELSYEELVELYKKHRGEDARVPRRKAAIVSFLNSLDIEIEESEENAPVKQEAPLANITASFAELKE